MLFNAFLNSGVKICCRLYHFYLDCKMQMFIYQGFLIIQLKSEQKSVQWFEMERFTHLVKHIPYVLQQRVLTNSHTLDCDKEMEETNIYRL